MCIKSDKSTRKNLLEMIISLSNVANLERGATVYLLYLLFILSLFFIRNYDKMFLQNLNTTVSVTLDILEK